MALSSIANRQVSARTPTRQASAESHALRPALRPACARHPAFQNQIHSRFSRPFRSAFSQTRCKLASESSKAHPASECSKATPCAPPCAPPALAIRHSKIRSTAGFHGLFAAHFHRHGANWQARARKPTRQASARKPRPAPRPAPCPAPRLRLPYDIPKSNPQPFHGHFRSAFSPTLCVCPARNQESLKFGYCCAQATLDKTDRP